MLFRSSYGGGKKLKVLRSDRGGEYLSNEMKHFIREREIKHEKTMAHTLHNKMEFLKERIGH